MHLYQVRRLILSLAVTGSLIVLSIVWLGHLCLYPPTESTRDNAVTLIATIIQTTAAIGAATLALVFLAAQLWAATGRPSILRELYRSKDIYIFLTYLCITLCAGYMALVFTPNPSVTIAKCRILDTLIVLAITSVMLLIPVVLSQVENLNQLALAAKLSARLNPKAIIGYGLTRVESVPGQQGALQYSLIMVGLRPSGFDPLRPMHELLMDAVNARDRVLFGKLFRYLLAPIARVYGGFWDPLGVKVALPSSLIAKIYAKTFRLTEKVHFSLAVLHYSVKRARNLLVEWENRDIGRHGIITGIGDLIRSLAKINDSDTTIRICLYATLSITKFYVGIRPYGRIEPMNGYFQAAEDLWVAGKKRDAILCAEILGWTAIHTKQLASDRLGSLDSILNDELHAIYTAAKEQSKHQSDWMPGNQQEDPWRDWTLVTEEKLSQVYRSSLYKENKASAQNNLLLNPNFYVSAAKESAVNHVVENNNRCPTCSAEVVFIKLPDQDHRRAQAIHTEDVAPLEPNVLLINNYSSSYRQKLLRKLGKDCRRALGLPMSTLGKIK